MKRIVIVGALVLIAGEAHADNYTLSGDAWTCKGPGALVDVETHDNTDVIIESEIKSAQCLPEFSDTTVNVIAFQGKYAFFCEKLSLNAKLGMGDIYSCSYALTKDLRDKKGAVVPDHVSNGETALRTPPPPTRPVRATSF
jgi:hypothetical protein